MTAPLSRTLSHGLAPLVADLELNQRALVTLDELANMARDAHLKTPPKILASRLRAAGWLLATTQRGVYEFAPGAHAGPFGHGDPFIDLRAASVAGSRTAVVALESALWLHGLADRAPNRHEVALPVGAKVPRAITHRMRVVRFSQRLEPVNIEGLAVHGPASILTHLASKPSDVHGWANFADVLSVLGERSSHADLERELTQRPSTVRPRLAYLLSGVAPALAHQLQPVPPRNLTWLGVRRVSQRFDKRFNVADSLLPFDPRTLPAAP